MMESVDGNLRDWAKSVAKGADVVLEAPRADDEKTTIRLHLLQVQTAVPTSLGYPRSLELRLNYLVTVGAANTESAHRVFGELLTAALGASQYAVELRELDAQFWIAFGVTPRPAFIIKCPYVVAREQPSVTLIRHAPEYRLSPAAVLSGVVKSKEDLPVARARVELPEVSAVTHTDEKGQFQFGAVPPRSGPRAIKVTVKGTERLYSESAPPNAPLVIRFDPKET